MSESGRSCDGDGGHGRDDREYPVRRYRYDHAIIHGWALYRVDSFVSWCGHGQEFLILPDADVDYVRLVSILGKAR